MRAHKLSWKILRSRWHRGGAAARGHRVRPSGCAGHALRVAAPARDTGDCNDNHHPCRTLNYALTQVAPGNAIKLAAGSYDVSGIDVENLLSARKACAAGTRRKITSPSRTPRPTPRACPACADAYRNNFIAHGFTVVDANGDPLPRIIMPKLAAPTACTNGMAGTFPCHNIDYLAQVQLQEIPAAPTSAQRDLGPRRSRRQPRVRDPRPSQWHGVL